PLHTDEPVAVPAPRMAQGNPSFTDAEGAARWLKTLPLASIADSYHDVLGQLNALAGVEVPPRERARIAEVLRDRVAFLHTELARRYAGKPQPPHERDAAAAGQAIALWQAMWEQYSACLKPLLEGDPDI